MEDIGLTGFSPASIHSGQEGANAAVASRSSGRSGHAIEPICPASHRSLVLTDTTTTPPPPAFPPRPTIHSHE
ncbi:hypothetical protein GCM10010502_31630 [Kitasatospora aureofaciens]|uniref:Uncharacterized protein n=1 Tax=Kitasatospora aureofaciens TaxID=1894 RepID=A0A8H9LTG8_KITAU|nr:hypothetical protein GCM10010502_31630 [Kitasatospora aureofaciens]